MLMARQVDDLVDITDLEACIEESVTFLLLVSKGYFASKNCMREVHHAVTNQRQIILLREKDRNHGAYAKWPEDAMAELEQACSKFDSEFDYEQLRQYVLSSPVVDWERIDSDLQKHSVVAIAQNLIAGLAGHSTFGMDIRHEKRSENARQMELPRLQFGGQLLAENFFFDGPKSLYASPNNPGALAFAGEISAVYPQVVATSDASVLAPAAQGVFLLYLNDAVFVGDKGRLLADEVLAAMEAEQPIVMAHEIDAATGGCEFRKFFEVTPKELLEAGVYKEIAIYVPAEASSRRIGIAQLAQKMGASLHRQSIFTPDPKLLWIKRDPVDDRVDPAKALKMGSSKHLPG